MLRWRLNRPWTIRGGGQDQCGSLSSDWATWDGTWPPTSRRPGTLQVMVGGDEAIYERVRPALLAIGDKVSYIGDIGSGSIAKLCHNTMSVCAAVALAEVFTLGVKAGVKPEKLLEAIQGGSYGQGRMLRQRVPESVFKGSFDEASFFLALARKDIGLATELAREFEVPVNLAN